MNFRTLLMSLSEDEKRNAAIAINACGSGQHPYAHTDNVFGFAPRYVAACARLARIRYRDNARVPRDVLTSIVRKLRPAYAPKCN